MDDQRATSSDGGAGPAWVQNLTPDELKFVQRFVMCSGSLKALAAEYGVSYPTLRTRLDGLIDKIRAFEEKSKDGPLKTKVRQLLSDGALSVQAAREIMLAIDQEQR